MKNLLLLLIAAVSFYGCKKQDDKPTTPEPATTSFWVVNLDTETHQVYGGVMNDKVLLKMGEKTKVYSGSQSGQYMLFWVKQSVVDTSYADFTLDTKLPKEVTIFIKKGPFPNAIRYYSSCSTPPAGKAIVRFIDVTGHNRAEAIKNKDTIVIQPGVYDQHTMKTSDPCNFVDAGTYTLNYYIPSNPSQPDITNNGVEFKAGKVYFVYVDYNNKAKVIER